MSAGNFGGGTVLSKSLAGRGVPGGQQPKMNRLLRTLLPTAAPIACALLAPAARGQPSVEPARGFAPGQVVVKFEGQWRGRAISLPRGVSVRRMAKALRRSPGVAYAEPNYVATASAPADPFDPDDTGALSVGAEASELGKWAYKQWNFLAPEGVGSEQLPLSPGGIDAVDGWRHLIEAGRPGAAGVVVAVLDTGIAYRSFGGRFQRSPDFLARQFIPGYDFVDRDRLPLDENGHGTHVAGTIGEATDNGIGLTGLAYRAKLMPVRVLDRLGRGNAVAIARGIRFAIANHAQVINMSFNFACGKRVPVVDEALREAFDAGIVTVASAGNLGSEGCVSPPATGPRVIAVGGTTEGGCMGGYALAGAAIDLVAPGGGIPKGGCPSVSARPIYQVTLLADSTDTFGIPAVYVGTSMAAAHVAGAAAMVLASRAIKPKLPGRRLVEALTKRLRRTARNLGVPRLEQGAGLIDVGRATEPRSTS